LKSWLTGFGAACGTISIFAYAISAPAAPSAKPAIVLADPADLAQWQKWAEPVGWQVIAPKFPPNTAIDGRVQAVETAAREAVEQGAADRAHIYLAGRGDAAAAVFYTVSREPDLWAAAVALGGSPQVAIDTGRLYTANFTNVPLLWISANPQDQQVASKLAGMGMHLEWRGADQLSPANVFDWLGSHARQEFPPAIDCETASNTFSRCYWIRLTKLDAAARNDALASSRIEPSIKPALDLGGFGYKIDDPGPGVLISFLPPKYSGPLKMGDRIVEIEGRPIADARAYNELMAEYKEEHPAAIMLQRGKERIRLETSVVLPKRLPELTARVQASFDSQAREIQIVSRTVAGMQVTVPAQWTPVTLAWNGVALEKLKPSEGEPRCFLLQIDKELENIGPCSK
jgi:hypothetical protein